MDILLINPRLKHWVSQTPLGLAYLAAYLRSNGLGVGILDMAALKTGSDGVLGHIQKVKPLSVGISGMTHQIVEGLKIARSIKKNFPEIKTIFGGVHTTLMPKEVLSNSFVDFVVVGEGEITTLELLNEIKGHHRFEKVKGIGYKKMGKIHFTKPRPFIENLDELSSPARDLLPMKKYREFIFGKRAMLIAVGRGCPFNCSFCCSPKLWGRRFRTRSPKNIVAEIKELKKKYGTRYFIFEDDTLTVSKDFVYNLCEAFISEKLNIRWKCLSRVNLVDKELLSRMKEAGCVMIEFGVESGDDGVLKKIKKGITVTQARNAAEICKEVGLPFSTLFMLGHPGETMETMKKTIRLAKELCGYMSAFQITTAFPGTELYEVAEKYGKISSENWEDYLTKNPTFLADGLTEKELVGFKRWGDIGYNNSPKRIMNRIREASGIVGVGALNPFFLYGCCRDLFSWLRYKFGV